MKIQKIISQHRRDFQAIYECEHCGYTQMSSGYDDRNFHDNVIPDIECPECKKKADGTYRPLRPKYDEGVTV